jgi:hypothetical protein
MGSMACSQPELHMQSIIAHAINNNDQLNYGSEYSAGMEMRRGGGPDCSAEKGCQTDVRGYLH